MMRLQSPLAWIVAVLLCAGPSLAQALTDKEKLGNPAADQAQSPFLNPVEQALPDNACVVYRVCNASDYPVPFKQIFPDGCDINFPVDDTDSHCAAGEPVALEPEERQKVNAAYDNIALAIATYEASPEVNGFTSNQRRKSRLMLHRGAAKTCAGRAPRQ